MSSLEWNGCPVCAGTTVQFAAEQVSSLRGIRSVAIGGRNYLFAAADSGGERAAAIYSLIGNARLNGVDPEAWLHHGLRNRR